MFKLGFSPITEPLFYLEIPSELFAFVRLWAHEAGCMLEVDIFFLIEIEIN